MIPKDLTGKELIKLLRQLGYEIVRQSGSHIRIQTNKNGKHSETIPNHSPLKQGTLRQILKNIAAHFEISLEELEKKLF
jgi:predicted RNA binding protein YcfA (HicA-like mRNA interferase family)